MKTQKLKVFALFSGGASGVDYLSKHDSNFNKAYEIIGGFTDNKEAKGIDLLTRLKIPSFVLDWEDFKKNDQNRFAKKEQQRQEYANALMKIVHEYEPDLIILSGFMRIIRSPLLTVYDRRIINVHPADLSITYPGTERRKFTGAHAVHDAIVAGEVQLASTIHFVDKEIDGGEIICISPKLKVPKNPDPDAVQSIMKEKCDGPAYREALELICSGKVQL